MFYRHAGMLLIVKSFVFLYVRGESLGGIEDETFVSFHRLLLLGLPELGELVDPGIFFILLVFGDDRIRLLTECSAFVFATAHSFFCRREGDAWEPGLVCIDEADALGPAPQSDLAALYDVPGVQMDQLLM